ncbi:MAG: YopX family protein [Oscillospiraceae bacterium]
MNNILFKAKRIDNNEWVCGDFRFDLQSESHKNSNIIYPRENSRNEGKCFFVDAVTVSQYTGKNDKNRIRIFEGDIVKCDIITGAKSSKKEKGIVFYEENICAFCVKAENSNQKYILGTLENLEVVGNIYDKGDI